MCATDASGLALEGRWAWVVGGSSGLGAIVSRFLLGCGCEVLITGRSRQLAWEESLPSREKARATYAPAVLETGEEFGGVIESLVLSDSKPSILIYAVGPIICRSLVDTEPEELALLLRTNVVGFQSAVRAFLPRFRADGYGRIVTFTAAGAENLRSRRIAPAYAAAKAALLSLVRSYARELAPKGITVNAIAPGWFAVGSAKPPNSAREPGIPAGRAGEKRDLLATLSFILSPESAYFTGNNLNVSGGYAV